MRTDGVLIPLKLSHSILADLIAAQRPSVTGALKKLSEQRLVVRDAQGLILRGDPPGELQELRALAGADS